MTCLPPEIVALAREAVDRSLPTKSESIYRKVYADFRTWMADVNVSQISETVLLAYFNVLSVTLNAQTLWSRYSMIARMIFDDFNIDIKTYFTLKAFLKRKSIMVQPKKAKVFTPEQINTFLHDADDSTWLATKVATIFGMSGACRRIELYNLTVKDVKLEGDVYLIRLLETKTHITRTFTVEGNHASFVTKYISSRPSNCSTDKFFLRFTKGTCYKQVIGINKFGQMPSEIAKWLNLPEGKSYTGHSFRRTSTTILSNAGASRLEIKRHGGWKSDNIAEGYIENSINNKRKISNLIANSIDKENVIADSMVNFEPRAENDIMTRSKSKRMKTITLNICVN